MAFQKVVDTAQISVIYSQHTETLQNTFYAHLATGYDLSDLDDLAAAIDVQVALTWLPQQIDDASYLRTEVRGLGVENDLFTETDTSAGVGTHLGASLPNNVTLSIKKSSGQTGRSARGRTYWIGCARTELVSTNENQFEAVYVQAIADAVQDIKLKIAATGLWAPVLVSRFTNGLARTEGELFPWLTSTAINNSVDTQRGRLS